MEQWKSPDCGVVRISNPKTLKKWIDLGWYQEEIKKGYIFNVGCGRFKTEVCTCSACRNRKNLKLLEIIENYNDEIELSKNHQEEFESELNNNSIY